MNFEKTHTFRPYQECLPGDAGGDSDAKSLIFSIVLEHAHTGVFLHSKKGDLYKSAFDTTGY